MQDALKEGGVNQAKAFQQQADIEKDHLVDAELAHQKYEQDQQENTNQSNYLFQQVVNSKVDPSRYWNSKGPLGKVAAAIGLILGGASSGLTGRANPALDVIQNAIKEDINAQVNDQSNAMNLYKMGLQKYKDRAAAEDYATMHMNSITQGMLQVAANKANSVQAQTAAKMAGYNLGLDNVQKRTNLAMQQAALNSMNAPTTQSGVNPDKLRLLTMAGIIPKEEVPIVDKESGEYQKLSNSLDEVDNVFNQAKQDATYSQRMAEGIPGGSILPTFRDSSKKFLAETNALLDKYTKDLTGRVTPQSMENLRHSIPLAGDSPDVFSRKLNSFKDIVREAYEFPTLQKYRVLSPNDPVIMSSGTRAKRFKESPVR